MLVSVGEGCEKSTYQEPFETECKCVHCGGVARLGFVAYESNKEGIDDKSVPLYKLRENGGKGDYWLHDFCAVAVYFCRECLKPTADYNQA